MSFVNPFNNVLTKTYNSISERVWSHDITPSLVGSGLTGFVLSATSRLGSLDMPKGSMLSHLGPISKFFIFLTPAMGVCLEYQSSWDGHAKPLYEAGSISKNEAQIYAAKAIAATGLSEGIAAGIALGGSWLLAGVIGSLALSALPGVVVTAIGVAGIMGVTTLATSVAAISNSYFREALGLKLLLASAPREFPRQYDLVK